MSDIIENLRDQGKVTSVGDILEQGAERLPTPQRFVPARLEGTPALPEPGIYFGMSEETYLALPALSNTGIKKLAASPMIFWASTPWLNPKKAKQDAEAVEKAHRIFGKAYHARIVEGRRAFESRFAVELDPSDYPDMLVSTDQIKAAIGQHMTADTRKTAAEGSMVPVKPASKVPDEMPDGTEYMRSAVKADWIAQLLELDPEAPVFARVEQEYFEAHRGKTFLTPDQLEELEIAALMVERDPELKDAFKGGHAEAVLIWYCPRTGVPMKAKLDYLKLDEIVDLKSVANQRERSIETAIRFEISGYHYNFQPVVYFDGVDAVRELVRKGEAEIHIPQDYEPDTPAAEIVAWVEKWAKVRAADQFLWVFQQKGTAPITRGVRFPRTGITHEDTQFLVERAKRHFIQFSEVFGTEPWLDIKPIYTIADEDIPRQATEI
jgi:hypothetical protein